MLVSLAVGRALRLLGGQVALAWICALLAWGGLRVGVYLARR
jgi:hypothetical protein